MSTVSNSIRQDDNSILLCMQYLKSPQFAQRRGQGTESVLSQLEGLQTGKVKRLGRDVMEILV